MNLHPGESMPELRAGIEDITAPLRARIAPGRRFGVGVYLPASVAMGLDAEGLDQLTGLFEEHDLEPFTFNAFPFGDFHEPGLKERVYAPDWTTALRLEYTLSVARAAAGLVERGSLEAGARVSISTHAGGWGKALPGPADRHAAADGMARATVELHRMSREGGPRIVLSVEAEPRSTSNDSAELAEFLVVARTRAKNALLSELGLGDAEAEAAASFHLGTCLDCCHSAVEFETPERSLALSRLGGRLGKIQYSSALTLANPGANAEGRRALLALDEPRYLHQVTGRGEAGLVRADDLPEVAGALEGGDASSWLGCEEWRCHFHVPVDLEALPGLGTTRAHAEAVLELALRDPAAWEEEELHVEIETYTWDVLPAPARGAGDLVDGLEREYRAVIAVLERCGWEPEAP